MAQDSLTAPVLFLIFNRPDTTQVVFEEIRKARPAQLFIAADGPRREKPDDLEKCRRTREIILQVDWDCKVFTLFRDENLGCKYAISSAIDWFFSQVDEGIILEDDCVPDQSFFPFCQELLEKYRDDERIMMISGDNFQFGREPTRDSYYFSRYFHIWGWATWKRAWNYYDVDMKAWPEVRKTGYLNTILSEKTAVKYWESVFTGVHSGRVNTWDYQWVLACWVRKGLSIIPNNNLVSNIGFEAGSTHTSGDSVFSRMPVKTIQFPLIHPDSIIRDCTSDNYTEQVWFSGSVSLKSLFKAKFNTLLKKIKQ